MAQTIFGDGELLVLATVIAAAGIGDLVFDLRRNRRQRSFRDASAIALALICVVTLYALVTLKREQLTPAQQNTATAVDLQWADVNSLKEQAAKIDVQLAEARKAQASALTNYEAAVTGKNGIPPGNGVLAQELLAQYRDARNHTNSLSEEAARLQTQLDRSQAELSQAQQEVNRALQETTPGATVGEGNRAAEASVWMFILGLFAGLNCLTTGLGSLARRQREQEQWIRSRRLYREDNRFAKWGRLNF